MGAPLPITGIGAPTVLIGGLPAARQTDFCACIAPVPVPVDPIILGSPVVIISGLPAAYMTAPTAKGGVILPPCCPTVLIGLTPKPVPVIPGAPAMPSSIQKPTADDPAELELIARSATPATYTPGSTSFSSGSGNPICATLAVEAKEIQDARNDALLASAVYGDPQAPLPPNTRRATQADLEALGLHDGTHDMTKIKDSNFRSEVFVQNDPITGEETYVVAFKGTTMTSLEDWGSNFSQGIGMQNAYYDQAMEIGRTSAEMQPGKVRFVGHSLGGGLASSAAAMSGAPAQTFNAAGLHPDTMARKGGGMNTDKTKAWFVEGDILSTVQDNLPLKEAAGMRKPLKPPPQPPTLTSRIAQGVGAVLGTMFGGPLGGVLGAIGADKLLGGVNLHLMDQVIGAIDQQAGAIAGDQAKNGCK